MKDNKLYLGHIRDAIEKIENYISDVDYEQFVLNDMMVDAVLRELAVIGEATNSLSKDFRRNHPEIPFRDIIDMRNILIHNYTDVDIKVVWETCKKNLPEPKRSVADIPG
jgi:uncharacterized protein with HEPN domain